MQIFYNRQGIGDVLLVQLAGEGASCHHIEHRGHVVRLLDADNRLIGINIFHVSSQGLHLNEAGRVELDQYVVNHIERILQENGVPDDLDFDLATKVVVGKIVKMDKHPDADRLQVCQVDVGDAQLQIVCGAPNVRVGERVVVARPGAVLPGNKQIRESRLRGVLSAGMICSAKELNMVNAPQEKGIILLNSTYPVGEEFRYEGMDYNQL
jgi:tRNA-binding protein